jgi:hypothetical protein
VLDASTGLQPHGSGGGKVRVDDRRAQVAPPSVEIDGQIELVHRCHIV